MGLHRTGRDDLIERSPRGLFRTRRQVLVGLAATAGGFALPISTATLAAAALPFAEIADGIFVRYGLQEEMSAENGAAIANIGFIVGEESVAVIDTGTTTQQGAALKAEIARITDRPVSHVIATHVHLDHCFGHGAFADEIGAGRVANVGHHRLPQALGERGGFYLERIRALSPDFADTRFIPPTTLVDTVTIIDLGNRRLTLRAWPTAHTDNDLSVEDARTGTLWTADLLFAGRIPVIDGSVTGWLSVLEDLAGRNVARVVPGHGPVDTTATTLQRERTYLAALREGVRTAIDEGLGINETVRRLADLGRGDWLLFDAVHGRNVVAAYTELEWE
ncbi:quinoprotein relay system zinc metallohydrolase 2 [Breoghania corrubedonensis]|uniref:Quinoprotein relay system zinc metallohydrolase 2 n=1 Tax=Breoghania corrubedonensis TaxID=665038 RepID=A0A2T5VE11_9HYPH|nr:quinoprotein relay system zinc metallohydrolase 2 [Breoghania corrubedonensis]PTW61991.1 quinoprotein relay system zinc metallohydrolase 2 [Breoghania corrubedonensis]